MFALAPTLVASPNETLTSTNEADISLPAAFVEETLRVAVYVENNVTLPAYAEGGVYTNYSANIISFLQGEGYAVTPLTTQDILDHKLLAANYDTFVLANQLPKDNIIDLVKDYWLAGGGILSFGGSIGFCFYTGMIDSSLEGDFQLAPIASPGYWAYSDVPLSNVSIMQRHPITQDYQVSDSTLMPAGNYTVINGMGLDGIIGDEFIPLVRHNYTGITPVAAGFDNPAQGGKIVHLPGNCSTIPSWFNPMITESIDWLAPKPKARVAIDYTHVPFYGVDSWDDNVSISAANFDIWRDSVVNHSSTFDKLYPTFGEELTADDLAPFDVLIINMPSINYTAAEITVIRTWVQNGGGLYLMGENTGGFLLQDQRIESIIESLGITFYVGSIVGTESVSEFEEHPIVEGVSSFAFVAGSYLNVSAPAYPVANFDESNIAMAGRDFGEGRILVIADVNHFDPTRIILEDNYQLGINVINWLSSGPAKVLVYADSYYANHPNVVPLNGPVAQALNNLGIPFFMTSNKTYFNMSLFRDDWDMVVFDNSMWNTTLYQLHLTDFVADGGKLIFSTWSMTVTAGAYFGVNITGKYYTPPSVFLEDLGHPIFNYPVDYAATSVNTTLSLLSIDARNLTTYANATPLARYSDSGVAIAIGAGGNVIVNGPALVFYNEDTDDSTYPDNVELWTNQIAYLYFDRPTINSPDDVTYMETETGNEISWTATADAGAWEYVLKENGTIIDEGHWAGGSLTFNIDGVNASLTEYELTVFDTLGYSASDLVILNVTEYFDPTTTGTGVPIDPMLLIIIGVGAIVVIVIIIIVMKKKK